MVYLRSSLRSFKRSYPCVRGSFLTKYHPQTQSSLDSLDLCISSRVRIGHFFLYCCISILAPNSKKRKRDDNEKAFFQVSPSPHVGKFNTRDNIRLELCCRAAAAMARYDPLQQHHMYDFPHLPWLHCWAVFFYCGYRNPWPKIVRALTFIMHRHKYFTGEFVHVANESTIERQTAGTGSNGTG